MRQGYLSGLMVVLWMITGGQNIATNSNVSERSTSLFQSTTDLSDNFIITTGSDRIFACDPPTGVSVGSITTTSASVNFISAGTSFIVEYGPSGFTPGTTAAPGTNGTIVTGSSSPIGLSGLTNGTAYDVYVRTDCGVDGFSVNTAAVSFSTTCGGAVNVPYVERFDEVVAPAVPSCVTVQNVNGGNTWRTVGTDFEVSYRNIMRLDWETDGVTPADDWFYTRGINLTGGTSYRLRFQYRNSDGVVYTEKMEVKYGTAANAASMTSGTLFTNAAIINDLWEEVDVDFTPASTGVYYIGFHGFSDADQAFLCVDNVNVIQTPACDPPTNVLISNINSTLASVNFVSAGTNFIVEYGAPGFTPGTGASAGGGIIATTTSSPLSLLGLAPSTTYDVYVRRDCGGGSFSPNSLVASFTTHLVNDDAPGAIAVSVDAACSGNAYTNLGATQSGNEPYASCEGVQGHNTVWYKFVAPVGGAVKISNDFAGSGLGDSRLAVFSATNVTDYNTFTILGCDNDNGVTAADKSILYLAGLTPGTTYYVQVDGLNSGSSQGSFCLEVSTLTSSMIAGTAACGNSQNYTGLNTSYRGWISLVDNSGNLIANVKQTAGTATDINANVNVNTAALRQDPVSLMYYLNRNYKIDAVGATNADVQFFFLNSEFTALQASDNSVTAANLGVTRQTGSTCHADFAAANGTNSQISQTSNGSINGINWIQVTTPGFSNFYLHAAPTQLVTKAFLQGAYNATLLRHKNMTAAWVNVMNIAGLNQPYSGAPFNYPGTESVSAGFFTATADTTNILDWVLLEVKDASLALVARRAAFIREDGEIVDLDGVSAVKFNNLPTGNYYLTLRHRNHLGISTQNLIPLTAKTLGVAGATGYTVDFSTALDADIFGTAAAYKVSAGKNVLICGNANSNVNVRYGGLSNDAGSILAFLLGVPTSVVSNVYSANDINMDGTVRYGGLNNDTGFFLSNALGGTPTTIVNEQKR